MKTASNFTEKNSHKKGINWRYIAYAISGLGALWSMLAFMPIPKKRKHRMLQNDRPLVIAHRGGAGLAPENTLAAFRHAVHLGVDIIELDIHLTKDGHLVVIHDDTMNRTTNGTGRVNELTLAEIQSYDAGFHFVDSDGNYNYREKGVIVPTLEAVLQEVPKNMRFTIEVKDTNDTELYEEIGKKLWNILVAYDKQDKVLIGSFDQEMLDMMTEITNGEAIISAGKQEVAKFVLLHKLRLHTLYKTKVNSLDIPMNVARLNLMDKLLIDAAKKRGMGVHYWTVNDRATMDELIDLGVDGIISDRPDMLITMLEKRKINKSTLAIGRL